MRQVLFYLPLHLIGLPDIPIYGYGAMLFVAFVFCTWLACRLAAREGIARERIQDLAIWMFVSGIAGARITFMIQYDVPFIGTPWPPWKWNFFKIWEGGLVFYGSAIGGAIGYFIAYFLVLRRHKVSSWKMADIIAPCAALGLCLGRFGCLLNGCCYGNVACPNCPAISFPLSAPPRFAMVEKGYQTAAGFTLKTGSGGRNVVGQVEPASAAARAGLRPGDRILKAEGHDVISEFDLDGYLSEKQWPRGKTDLTLRVRQAAAVRMAAASTVGLVGSPVGPGPLLAAPAVFPGRGEQELTFAPRTIGLNPTQLYESISMFFLFLLMMAYYPLRRRDGEVMLLFMLGYAVHRFFNEILRDDTAPVSILGWRTGMTLSQNISVLVLAGAVVMALILWRRPVQYRRGGGGSTPAPAEPAMIEG